MKIRDKIERETGSLLKKWGFNSNNFKNLGSKCNKYSFKNYKEFVEMANIKGFICKHCRTMTSLDPIKFELIDRIIPGCCALTIMPIFLCESCQKEFVGTIFVYGENNDICNEDNYRTDGIKFHEYMKKRDKTTVLE